jgi:hypothetical protein
MFGNGKHASLLRKNKNNDTKKVLWYSYLSVKKCIFFVADEEAKLARVFAYGKLLQA